MSKCAFKALLCGVLLLATVWCSGQEKAPSPYTVPLSQSDGYQNRCGFDLMMAEMRKDPKFAASEKKMNDAILKQILSTNRVRLDGPSTLVPMTLPVVVHIVNRDPTVWTDAQIAAGIQDLNDAFSKKGAWAASKGADTKIQFVLAKKDPNGGNTTGITRVKTEYGKDLHWPTEGYRMQQMMEWDTKKYINIWLVENIINAGDGFQCGTWYHGNSPSIGTPPFYGVAGTTSDGIAVPSFGLVLIHEMGHYLGLYDVSSGGCTNNNCLTDGDMVCDTPPVSHNVAVTDCTKPTNTCNTDTSSSYSNGFFPRDTTDAIYNFMDYFYLACLNEFTQGQSERMQATILSLRSGLISNVITAPCATTAVASFSRDIYNPKIGETVTFTNNQPTAARYEWYVNDTLVSTAATLPARAFWIDNYPIYLKHSVTLKAFDASGCFSSQTDYVLVNCGLISRFSSNKRFIASNTGIYVDTINFTNRTVSTLGGTTTYEWAFSKYDPSTFTFSRKLITSNVPGGGANDLYYQFPDSGFYNLRLIATNGGCKDSTDAFYFTIANPKQDARVYLGQANCYQDTKVRVGLQVCNNGYATIPTKMPITFYDDDPTKPTAKKIGSTFFLTDSVKGYCCSNYFYDTIDVGYKRLDKLYVVVNNITSTVPVVFPDPAITAFTEKGYADNIDSLKGFGFIARIVPPTVSLQPGDKQVFSIQGLKEGIQSIVWSPPANFSCTSCSSPTYTADTVASTAKQVVIKSFNQCTDTATVFIKIPSFHDYTVAINSVTCSGGEDSVLVDFTISDLYTTPLLPKGLPVAFYKNDPLTNSAILLGPVFTLPGFVSAPQQSYKAKIKKPGGGAIYGSVNDAGKAIPVVLTDAPFGEKVYTNNFANFTYTLPSKTIDTTICGGLSYAGHTVSGTYYDTVSVPNGCDSVHVVKLTVRSTGATFVTINTSICEGGNVAGFTQTGTYVNTFMGSNGCDSVRTLNLTVNPIVKKSYTVAICKGQSYMAGGKLQTQTGIYIDTTKSAAGCDSITTINLTVDAVILKTYDATICKGQSYPAAGSLRTQTGVYRDTVRTSGGCDSVTVTNLTVTPPVVTTKNVAICSGTSFLAGGKLQTQTGTYYDTSVTTGGCQAVLATNLTVTLIKTINNIKICKGNSYFAAGASQTQSGVYNDTLKTAGGCDSLVVTNLTVTPLPTAFLPNDTTLCTDRELTINLSYPTVNWSTGSSAPSITITQAGTYTANVIDKNGCAGSDVINVTYMKCIAIQVPDAFTPNNDGKNDVFKPMIGVTPTNYTMQIWSRWGQLMFETHNPKQGWDGKFAGETQQSGAYIYTFSFIDPDGIPIARRGTVILIR